MARKMPVDCKRITETHLHGLDDDQLGLLALRIEVQTQALNRAMRLVAQALVDRQRAA